MLGGFNFSHVIALAALLLLFGVFSSRISSRLNVPILLLFLGTGMLVGSNWLGYVDFNNQVAQNNYIANYLGTLAMAFILYSGGLETDFRAIRKVLWRGAVLATAGVLLTAVILGVVGCWLLNWSVGWGLLLGAVVASTDAAAVFSILRSRNVSLNGNMQSLLEFESGSNDPMAALLTIFMLGILQKSGDMVDGAAYWNFLWIFVVKMTIGVIGGVAVGRLGCWLFNKIKLDYEGLYFVLGIAIVLFGYGMTETFYGNGFMAAYVAGVTMGNRRYNFRKGQLRFNNGLAWLMQVALFMVLGMLVAPEELFAMAPDYWYNSVWAQGLTLALVLMFVARPAAVFICMAFSRFSWRERTLISWVGLRGAAPIVLATFPLAAQLGNPEVPTENATMLFNLVFFMVIMSVLIQGRTLMPLARLLRLDRPLDEKNRMPLELEETGVMNSVMHEFEVAESAPFVHRTLAELNFPTGVLVLLIRRRNAFILARGNTRLEPGDGMLIMGDSTVLREVGEKYFPENDFWLD